jgi:hypothetical protein
MIKPSDYGTPDRPPFGMLANYGFSDTSQAESFLVWMLVQCQEKGDWGVVQTNKIHPTLVAKGLLEEAGDRQYRLTRLAKGLLYAYYGKEE